MKNKRYTTEWYQDFPRDDTRYYGLFIKGLNTEQQKVSVDMNRFCEYFHIDDDRKNLKTNKNSKLFKPEKNSANEYKINVIKHEISQINKEWHQSQKIFIDKFLSEIKGHNLTPMDDDNLQMGLVEYDEAATNARMQSILSSQYAEYKRTHLFYSLYAQYYHQLAAQIDAVILRLLTNSGYEGDSYNRGVLLAFKGPNKESSIRDHDSYQHYEKMYAIWNFIKHNSSSTYEKVKKYCPETLIEQEYSQGKLACYFLKFTNELIEETITGMHEFLIKYCQIVFGEDEKAAGWNHDDFFLSYVIGEINEYNDPHGLGNGFY